MDYFVKVKRYFDLKIYNEADVWDFVDYSKITQTQYAEITKAAYPTTRPAVEK